MVKFHGKLGGKITQEYGNSDSIYFPIDSCDYCGVIVDSDDKDDWEKRQYRIQNVINAFLIQVGRIKIEEPEHLVKTNLTFSKTLPGLNF